MALSVAVDTTMVMSMSVAVTVALGVAVHGVVGVVSLTGTNKLIAIVVDSNNVAALWLHCSDTDGVILLSNDGVTTLPDIVDDDKVWTHRWPTLGRWVCYLTSVWKC